MNGPYCDRSLKWTVKRPKAYILELNKTDDFIEVVFYDGKWTIPMTLNDETAQLRYLGRPDKKSQILTIFHYQNLLTKVFEITCQKA